jgi:hypothetical protein
MRQTRIPVFALLVFLLLSISSFAGPANTESIEINKRGGAYEVTVPVSRLIMTIPEGGLSQEKNARGGSTDSPRYFYFEDKALQLIISGWFESSSRFQGVKSFWDDEMRAWKRNGLPEPVNVIFIKIANWDAIFYDISIPQGNNSHIRAHWLQAGTWIDIHLSMISNRSSSEVRAALQSLLKDIQVKEKGVQKSGIREYSLPDHGSLQLGVSASWKDELRQPPNRLPPTIVFRQDSGDPFEILITPLWSGKIDSSLLNADELKQNVRATADQLKSQAVEKVINVKEVKSGTSFGYYFTLTDRAPKPGEFKYMTQGIMRVGDLPLAFTVLTNDGQLKIIEEALTMIKSANHKYTGEHVKRFKTDSR